MSLGHAHLAKGCKDFQDGDIVVENSADINCPTCISAYEENPLLFWVAYLPMLQADGSEKKNYLSDGKGNLRMYKSEGKLRDYLIENTTPEFYKNVVVHSVQGQIVVPDDGVSPQFVPSQLGLTPIPIIPTPDIMPTVPIQHFDTRLSPPTAIEQLEDIVKRKKRRRRS